MGKAHALTVTSAGCLEQANNSLRYNCNVTVDGIAEAWVEFCNAPSWLMCGPAARETRRVPFTGAGSATVVIHRIPFAKPYVWRPVAKLPGQPDSSAVRGTGGSFTTDPQSAEQWLQYVGVEAGDEWGTRDEVKSVLLNYACGTGANVARHDFLVAMDAQERIVWYEDPSDVVGGTRQFAITGLSVSPVSGNFLAILGHEYVVEYDPDGESGEPVRLYCHDNGSGDCSDTTSVTPDATFVGYVHHDVVQDADHTWILSAEEKNVTDTLDCDGDSSTTDEYPIVVDGVYGFDTSTDALDEGWTMMLAYPDMAYDDGTCTGAKACGGGYWDPGDGEPNGCDWSHANSFWLDDYGRWTFSLRAWDRILAVDGDSTSSTYQDTLWSFDGDGDGEDMSVDTGLTFSGQHAASWMDETTMLLYDNDQDGSPASRGLLMAVDDSTSPGTAALTTAFEMLGPDGTTTLDCQTGGNFVATDGGTYFALCVGIGSGATADWSPLLNEFDDTGALVWSQRVSCDAGGAGRRAPSYKAVPNPF
jgi:hypothetical protein